METATKETALKRITELVGQFDEGYNNYKKTTYDEAKTRGTFIDEFFKALGWDIHNKEGLDESYRDVIPEDKIKVEGRTKAPDYCFTIYGQRKFFVEAKKPSVPIKTDNASVFQLRRYGYHKKLPISIITNFEEFAVYDCTRKPALNDKTSVGRIRHINYKEFVKGFDFLWDTFSKESVLKGLYDKFVKSDTEKRGTSTVDSDFLVSLNEWRTYLAKSIAWNNHRLTQEEVQYAVQQTIDRIIFLIFCEYKKIEPWGDLKSTTKKGNLYKNLFELLKQADDKYNSGLFDFQKDQISAKLSVDNKVINNIIFDLYPPKSEYDFSILPVEVLGNAYEQFLGKIIRITPGHIVKIEDKPEVKKAGGVFYTPEYIVDYIVKNTVGKLIHGKTPEQISKIKIVDPACGSGSFLLGAYQLLLNYHTDYYLKKGYKEKKIKNNPLTPEGRLMTEEKRKILLNNIFGVDIDQQAVEVTKLSLLLKAMEGETEVSIKRQLQIFHERVLPNIDGNIKCGNSLIGYDFFDGQLELDKEEKEELKKKINPFDWNSGFPEIFKQGGFDCVIGNPPYLNTKRGFAEEPIINSYFKSKYRTATRQFDAYSLFIEKAIKLLKSNGKWGYIIPKPILINENMTELRKIILQSGNMSNIGDFGTPFQDANVESVVICQVKTKMKNNKIDIFIQDGNFNNIIEQSIFLETPNNSFTIKTDNQVEGILKNIELNNQTFKSLMSFSIRGVEAGKKDETIKTFLKNKKCRFLLRGEDVSRYKIDYQNLFIEVDFDNASKFKDESIYNIRKKLLIRRVGGNLQATLDKEGYWNLNTIYNVKLLEEHYEFVLGIFNSKLISFWFKKRFVFEDKLFPYVRISQIEKIPFPKINLKKKSFKTKYDEIVKQVDNLLQLNKDIHKTKTPAQHEQIQNQILYSETRIDELVFELYGLSKKDIETIKNNLP